MSTKNPLICQEVLHETWSTIMTGRYCVRWSGWLFDWHLHPDLQWRLKRHYYLSQTFAQEALANYDRREDWETRSSVHGGTGGDSSRF